MTDLDTEPDSEHEATGRALGRSSLINLVGFAVYGVTGFLLTVVLTRNLGPTGAGAALLAIAVFSIVSRSSMIGTDLALVRFTSRFLARGRDREVRRLYPTALRPVGLISATAGLAVFLLAGPLGELLGSEETAADVTLYLRVLAPFIPLATVYQVLEGGSRGFGSMVPSVAIERFGRSSALPVIMWAAIAAGGGVTAVALAWAGPFAVALVAMALWTIVLLRRVEADAPTETAPDPLEGRELSRRLWSFALPRSLAGIFALTITWVDTLMLGALSSTEDVGIYTAAVRWLLVGNFAGNAVTLAFGPQISRVMARDGAPGGRRLFPEATSWLVLLAWPPYLTAIVFAPVLLRAFGAEFSTGSAADDGAAVIAITGLGFLLAAATGPIDMLLLMAGRSRLSLINTGIALVVNVGANLVLIPRHGIRGAAVAWALSLAVANGLPLVQMWRAHGISPWGPRSIRALALATAAGAALLASRALLGATMTGLALGLALAAAVLIAGILTAPDRMGVAQVLGRTR